MGYQIYRAREVAWNAKGWIVEFDRLDMPNVSDPDMRWPFRTRKMAERFATRRSPHGGRGLKLD